MPILVHQSIVYQTHVRGELYHYQIAKHDTFVNLVLLCEKEDSRENAGTNALEKWTLTLAGDIDRADSTNVHQVLAELGQSRDRRSYNIDSLYFSLQNATKDWVGNRPIFRALIVTINLGRRNCS